ncbi:MAG: sulfite exporter TauE/SafE family protein [Burkholderiaceae bacterium]|nr:sulfite exporter TauE/SafE family protein [Burkholderiaceae bacterium]
MARRAEAAGPDSHVIDAPLVSGIGPLLIVELLALGLGAGFLAGLLGIGGGMLLVPFLTLIVSARGVPPALAVKMAIATSMATILFTSLSSLRAHHRHGAVRWPLVRGLAPGIVLGGLLSGAGVFALLKGQGLAVVFAVFVGFSALQMLRDRKPAPHRQMPGWAGQMGAGGTIGLVSGLVGAGGAFMSVPFMLWCNVPLRHAVGTSAALGFPIALSATAGYVIGGWSLPPALPGAVGYLYLPALFTIAAASVLMAPLGARTAHRIDVQSLRRLFALLLMALAATMLWRVFA